MNPIQKALWLRSVACGLLQCSLIASLAVADDATQDVAPRHVRVIWHSDPATSATISWTTSSAGSYSRVKLRSDGDGKQPDAWQTIECQRSEQYASTLATGPAPFTHHTKLTGLKPATTYRLVCQTDKAASPEYHFTTAPDDDRPIAILFGGDSRSGLRERQQVNRMLARLAQEQIAAQRPTILALAHGGDFIVHGRKLDQWLRWLADHELTASPDGRLLPVIPTRGNHDMGPLFNQVFGFPKNDGNYYAVNLNVQTRLATLNTEISTAGEQRDWLAKELADNRWRSRWYLAQYHKPAFPAVKIPSGSLTNWVPLFDEYRLNLVCEADGHNIKRTPPIHELKMAEDGVVYIGEGGLGVGQRTPKTNRWYLQPTADKCGAGHHVHLLTFFADRMNCKVIRLGGELFDEFNLAPRSNPKQAKKTTTEASVVTQ